jgi:hypothetical protein
MSTTELNLPDHDPKQFWEVKLASEAISKKYIVKDWTEIRDVKATVPSADASASLEYYFETKQPYSQPLGLTITTSETTLTIHSPGPYLLAPGSTIEMLASDLVSPGVKTFSFVAYKYEHSLLKRLFRELIRTIRESIFGNYKEKSGDF